MWVSQGLAKQGVHGGQENSQPERPDHTLHPYSAPDSYSLGPPLSAVVTYAEVPRNPTPQMHYRHQS